MKQRYIFNEETFTITSIDGSPIKNYNSVKSYYVQKLRREHPERFENIDNTIPEYYRGRPRKPPSDDKYVEAKREVMRRYFMNHRDRILEKNRNFYHNNKNNQKTDSDL